MSENPVEQVRETVAAIYGSESRRVLATLIRLLGDFELAEEALHDAFAAAVEQWQCDGIPANPPLCQDSCRLKEVVEGEEDHGEDDDYLS